MGKGNLFIGGLVLLTITAAHVYPMITGTNSWPISNYPMFSHRSSNTQAQQLGIIAKTSKGEIVLLPMVTNKGYWYSYDEALKKDDQKKLKNQVLSDYSKAEQRGSKELKEKLKNLKFSQLNLVRFTSKVNHKKELSQSYRVLYTFNL
jgi:hypothetical protein